MLSESDGAAYGCLVGGCCVVARRLAMPRLLAMPSVFTAEQTRAVQSADNSPVTICQSRLPSSETTSLACLQVKFCHVVSPSWLMKISYTKARLPSCFKPVFVLSGRCQRKHGKNGSWRATSKSSAAEGSLSQDRRAVEETEALPALRTEKPTS